jgi:hypothetical protein
LASVETYDHEAAELSLPATQEMPPVVIALVVVTPLM